MNPDFINQVVNLINEERTQANLDPLQMDRQLSEAAQLHSESMADDDFFSHYGVDGSSPFDRIEDAGYQYARAAENLAAGYQTPEAVVQGWMNSSGHRANILNSDLTEIGVGYEYLANDTGSVNYNSYWTTTFGTPSMPSEKQMNSEEKMNPDFINQVVDLINEERTQANLDPLQMDRQLSEAAQLHSESMAGDNFFSHYGVDGSSPFDRIEDAGYQYARAAENLAAGYQTPEAVVQGWMNSSGHRANILNSDLTEIGVGYEYLANDTGSVNYNSYWTTTFGTPL
jgi:uncharacterized protein YkwD